MRDSIFFFKLILTVIIFVFLNQLYNVNTTDNNHLASDNNKKKKSAIKISHNKPPSKYKVSIYYRVSIREYSRRGIFDNLRRISSPNENRDNCYVGA